MVPAESTSSPSKSSLMLWLLACTAVVVVALSIWLMRSMAHTEADATTAAVTPTTAPASAAATLPDQPGPRWHELNATQQAVLKPLANVWNSLGLIQKKKWIVIAKNFPTLSHENQARLQERMVQWAALTPRERELARLNFAETKKLTAEQLAASWAAYQELSPEERARLAATAAKKPTGSAVAIAPVPNDKITAVPITRHTPVSAEASPLVKPQLDPDTLLPKIVIPPSSTDTPPGNTEPVSRPAVSSDSLSPN